MAIEVKYQTQERTTKGLIEAMERLGLKEGLLIPRDIEKEETIDGKKIRNLPLWKFLLDL